MALILALGFLFAFQIWNGNDDRANCEKAILTRDWEGLRRAATKWLERSPRNGDAWMYLAQAAENRGDMAWTATALARVPDSHPRAASALHKHFGITTGPLNRPLEAAETLERLLSVDARNPIVHRQAIEFFAQTFQHSRLLEQIRNSISLQCEPPEAYIYLVAADGGLVALPPGRHERWVAAHPDCPLFGAAKTLNLVCRQAHERSSNDSPAESPGNTPGIDTRLNAALARFPDNVELLAVQIERNFDGGDVDRACRLLDRASARTREDDRFWRYAAQRYAALKQPEVAEATCRRAQELNPLSWKTRRMLATLLRDGGRADEALPLERLADEGEAIHGLVVQLEHPAAPPAALLRRIADFAAACDDDLVARGIKRHLE